MKHRSPGINNLIPSRVRSWKGNPGRPDQFYYTKANPGENEYQGKCVETGKPD
jgi:hypothetical protein